MELLLKGFHENPLLLIVFIIAIVGGLLSIGPMLRGRKIGRAQCNRCGHVGNLKQTMTNQLVCSNCGSGEWKKVS